MLKKIFLGCTFLLFAASAHAANLAFLKDSVLTRLSPDDVASFRQLVLHSLQTVPDYEVVFWQGDSGVRASRLGMPRTERGRLTGFLVREEIKYEK